MTAASHLIQQLWAYCNILLDDRWPCDIGEAMRRLSVVEELDAVVSANLQRAVRLRHSILQKAFTGQL